MSIIVNISGKKRTAVGSTACRRLRAEGVVPCNVYGHRQDPDTITVDAESLASLVRSGHRVVDLEVDGKTEKALVKEVQWDTFSTNVLHVDFLRVDPDERVRLDVPLQLKGTAPGVVAGGVLEIPHHTVTIECLAVEIPDYIQVKVGSLGLGDSIHAGDLTDVPAGVKIITPADVVLVHIVEAKVSAEPVAEASEAAAEPALVKPAAKEGGEGGKSA